MTVRGGDTWRGLIVTKDATGALAVPGVGPAGALYVNGVLNGAAVAIAGANPYSWSVVLPALAVSDRVSMYITATIGGIATAGVVAEESADTHLTSDLSARIPAALVAGRMDSSVGAMANNVLTSAALDATAADEITADVWAEPLPGAYAAGTAGFILGNIVVSLTVALTASAAFLAAIANAVWTWGTRTLTSLATALVGRAQEWLAANLSMEFCQGETKTVQLVITTQAGGVWDITNYTVVWVLSATRGGAALITKTTADGSIVLNDPTHGGAVFTLTSTETNALAAQTYWHESHIKSPGGVESCVLHGRCTVTESTIGAI